MVDLTRRRERKPFIEGRGAKWVLRHAKALTVMAIAFTSTTAAWAMVTSYSLLEQFSTFREIARIGISGESLPALHAKRAVYKELLEEEQNKRVPDARRLREYIERIRKIDYQLLYMRRLERRYRRR